METPPPAPPPAAPLPYGWHPLQIEAWRRMTPTRKAEIVQAGIDLCRQAVAARLRLEQPAITGPELRRAVARALLTSRG